MVWQKCIAALVFLVSLASSGRADIYRWDNGQLIPGTEDIAPGPGVHLDHRQLEYASLDGQDLTDSRFDSSNLANARLFGSTLTGANLSGATVTGADFGLNFDFNTNQLLGTGLTSDQLQATASYGAKNLQGIGLTRHDLTGWDFSGQNLSNADLSSSLMEQANLSGAILTNAQLVFSALNNANLSSANLSQVDLSSATLTDANFSGATVTGTNLGGATSRGFTEDQLRSTASYQAKKMHGIKLAGNDLTGWDFSGQDLSNADLYSTMNQVNLTGATVTGARFDTWFGGLTHTQLASTASYQARNLQGIEISNGNVNGWDFSGQNLSHANLSSSAMEKTNLSGANLTNANLSLSTLTDANLTGATVTGANFSVVNLRGITQEQLASTASFQAKNLQGIILSGRHLTDWDFSGQNLSHANLRESTLTNVNLSGAVVAGASFGQTTLRGFTLVQLASTASYQAKNLQGIGLFGNDLTSWDFSGQDLTSASLGGSKLTDADLSGAVITGASFHNTTTQGFTYAQLASTDSFQAKNLQRIGLSENDLTGWDLSGQDLTFASLDHSTLANANLSEASLADASLVSSTLTETDLSGANLTNAILSFATLNQTDFSGTNLKNTYLGEATDIKSAVFSSSTIYNRGTVFPAGFDPVSSGLTLMLSAEGDFDANDALELDDIDLLQLVIRKKQAVRFDLVRLWWLPDAVFDLNSDSRMTQDDLTVWVKDIKHTWFGDANLDRAFDTTDLVLVFQAGEYEDDIAGNSTWSTGDWNSDGDFTTSDLVLAFQDGGYEAGPRAVVAAIPEPGGSILLATSLYGLLGWRANLRRSSPRVTPRATFADDAGRPEGRKAGSIQSPESRLFVQGSSLASGRCLIPEGDGSLPAVF